jgi:hypothetical protein
LLQKSNSSGGKERSDSSKSNKSSSSSNDDSSIATSWIDVSENKYILLEWAENGDLFDFTLGI